MKPKFFLLTTVETDVVTTYLSKWSEKLEDEAGNRGFDVVNLRGPEATRQNLENRIKSRKPNLLMFNGHGQADRIQGYKESLLAANENEAVTKDLLVYARTCACASVLGKSCEKNGVKAFVGYSGFFLLPTDKFSEARPFEDEFAAPVMRTSNFIVKVLIKGNSVKEAVDRSNQHAEKEVEYVKSSKFPDAVIAPLVVGCLKSNQRALTVLGDEEARVA